MTGDPLTGVSEDFGCERSKEEKAFGREVSGTKRDVSVPKYLLRIAERAKTAKEYVEKLFVSRGNVTGRMEASFGTTWMGVHGSGSFLRG